MLQYRRTLRKHVLQTYLYTVQCTLTSFNLRGGVQLGAHLCDLKSLIRAQPALPCNNVFVKEVYVELIVAIEREFNRLVPDWVKGLLLRAGPVFS